MNDHPSMKKNHDKLELVKFVKYTLTGVSTTQLEWKGRFFKDTLKTAVKETCGMEAYYITMVGEHGVDYPREYVLPKYWEELIPLSKAASEPHDPELEITRPRDFLALNGRPVAFALRSKNPELGRAYDTALWEDLMKEADNRYNTADNKKELLEILKDTFRKRHIEINYNPPAIEHKNNEPEEE